MSRAADKMPLKEYLHGIADQVLTAVALVEARHPEWEVGTIELGIRCVLKPVRQGADLQVYADIDEPALAAVSEIPLRLRRRADVGAGLLSGVS